MKLKGSADDHILDLIIVLVWCKFLMRVNVIQISSSYNQPDISLVRESDNGDFV